MRYVRAQLHCHSSIEGPASIGAHCYEARRAGVEVVWLTDHDTRISLSIGGPFLDRFDFDAPEVTTSVERVAPGGRAIQRAVGWSVRHQDERLARATLSISREQAYTGDQSMLLDVAGGEADEWQHYRVEFAAEAKLHSRPLLSDPTVGLAVRLETETPDDAEAWLDLVLSEQPPDLRQARLRYLLLPKGAPTSLDAIERHVPEHEDRYRTHVVPLPTRTDDWERHEVRPARDATAGGLGGVDNAMHSLRLGVRVRRGAHLRLFADNLTLAHRSAWRDLHHRQRTLARETAAAYGVVCHVAQEISQAGQHKNAWGAHVPLLDYPANLGGFTHDQGIAWARQHGAVFSLNHPFNEYARVELDATGRARAVADKIERYAVARAWGANTLEVGFPAGRHGFPLTDYLRLWDSLMSRGVYIAGSGSSDAHSARVGWRDGNNFVTCIRADATSEQSLLAGLRSGDLSMADPIRFRSQLAFHDDAGHRMGQVVAGPAGSRTVTLALSQAQPSWRLYWVVDGVRRTPVTLGSGTVEESLPVNANRATFVRAEIWDPSLDSSGLLPVTAGDVSAADEPIGRCIALTNAICYCGGPVPDDVPVARRERALSAESLI